MSVVPGKAMVLAAGLGKRMRPLTENTPKPMIPVAGKPLLDWGLDALGRVGVQTAIVNVHYLSGQIVDHVAGRISPKVIISDETDLLLDSAGAMVKALPLLGSEPFYVLNADTFWIDTGESNLERLALEWDGARMDILIMLADPDDATGHSGSTDFLIDAEGRLTRCSGRSDGMIYAGAAIVHPRLFDGIAAEPHSLNRYFDATAAAGRLFGMVMRGHWITVGTPDAIASAESAVARHGPS
jgi:MurNAc alpha-1-phosphate uridylyltransferase